MVNESNYINEETNTFTVPGQRLVLRSCLTY
jgi:hypothetical protein